MTEDVLKLQGVIRSICILASLIKESLSVESKNYEEIEMLNNLILKYIEDVEKDYVNTILTPNRKEQQCSEKHTH